MPAAVIVTDHDDPDIDALRSVPGTIHFPLGLESDRYRISARNLIDWEIGFADVTLSAELLSTASAVVYRRWRSSPPAAPVSGAAASDPEHRSFIERQWSRTVMTLLGAAYRQHPARWSRNPAAIDDKLLTLYTLTGHVTTPLSRIDQCPPPDGEWVWKPIDTDQSCGGGRASTIAVRDDDRETQPCPGLYQEFIDTRCEIRVGYVFGVTRAVAQYRSGRDIEPVDLRYAAPHREALLNADLEREADTVAKRLGLAVYTADVLVDAAGNRFWCDVNPDGLFCGADTEDGHLSTAISAGLSAMDQKGRV